MVALPLGLMLLRKEERKNKAERAAAEERRLTSTPRVSLALARASDNIGEPELRLEGLEQLVGGAAAGSALSTAEWIQHHADVKRSEAAAVWTAEDQAEEGEEEPPPPAHQAKVRILLYTFFCRHPSRFSYKAPARTRSWPLRHSTPRAACRR